MANLLLMIMLVKDIHWNQAIILWLFAALNLSDFLSLKLHKPNGQAVLYVGLTKMCLNIDTQRKCAAAVFIDMP